MPIVTWDMVNKGTGVTLDNGNLTANMTTNNTSTVRATLGRNKGKWYWEVLVNRASSNLIGIMNDNASFASDNRSSANIRYYYSTGNRLPESTSYGASYSTGDIISVLLDLNNGTLEFWKNGESQGVSHTNIKGMGMVYPGAGTATVVGSGNPSVTANFGASPFIYQLPTGYSSYNRTDKILILSDGEYLTYNNSEWQTVTTSIPTEQDFLNHGMDDITMLNSQILSELNSSNGKVDIVYYTDDTNKQEANLEITANYSPLDELDDPELLLWTDDKTTELKELKVTAVPRPKLVMPLRDLDIKGDLEKLELSVNISSNILHPRMTSNTTPSGIVSASNQYTNAGDAWRAFSGILNGTGWYTNGAASSGWIKYEFPNRCCVFSYRLLPDKNLSRSPKSWALEGSDDNVNWVTIDNRVDQSDWEVDTWKEFKTNNETFYKIYRLNIFSRNGSSDLGIQQIEFLDKANSEIKITVSGDQGSTWKTFKQNTWQTVDISNLLNVKNNGMTAEEVNSLTREDWLSLNPNQKIRLAYYMEQENSKETVEINSLSSVQRITTSTPTLNSLTIIYDELDKKYSGLMFMDTSEQYYSTSIGEILKYLDMGTLVAGQTSLDIKVKLTNTYPFDVKNIRLWSEHDIEGLTVEFSKSTNPFISKDELFYDQQLNFDEVIEFYIRLSVDPSTQSGGNFDIRVSADPV